MRVYEFERFGIEHLRLGSAEERGPGAGEIVLSVRALALNYRDLMVVNGMYNPRLRLPATPISDAAGVVAAVGPGVERVKVGDRVCTQFVAGWLDGPFDVSYVRTSLGTPGPGLAVEQAVLPADAVVAMPAGYTFAEAATLPIAALTAWSCLRNAAQTGPGQTVLTLGTGGVSIFALQLAKALGATVIITSSSDEKLERARGLGADHGVNYRKFPSWHERVLEITGGRGVDLVVETGGAATLDESMSCCRGEATVALLGALTGLRAEVTTGLILMRRLRVCGIYVDSRARFEELIRFIDERGIRPVIGATFPFDRLADAFRLLQSGRHFGKVVVEL